MASDFAEKFSASTGIAPERWHAVALRCALYPHARLLRRMVAVVDPDFFAADHDFIESVGRLTRRRDFSIEASEFSHHPANRGFLRRVLRIRVSVRRMQSLVSAVLADNLEAPASPAAPVSIPPPRARA